MNLRNRNHATCCRYDCVKLQDALFLLVHINSQQQVFITWAVQPKTDIHFTFVQRTRFHDDFAVVSAIGC